MTSRKLQQLSRSSLSEETRCLLCSRGVRPRDFPMIIQDALDRKYCGNLNNYHHLKTVNDIIANEKLA